MLDVVAASRRPWRSLPALVTVVALMWQGAPHSPGARPRFRLWNPTPSHSAPSSPTPTLQTYLNVPMVFEPNLGQTATDAAFVARGRGYALEIQALGTRMVLGSAPNPDRAGLDMHLVAANGGARVEAKEPQPGKSHYLLGNDASRYVRDVPHFAKVAVDDVYPGIDLVYYGRQSRLEYDFVVAPGADPRQIALRFTGYESMELSPDGDLVFQVAGDRQLRADGWHRQSVLLGAERQRGRST